MRLAGGGGERNGVSGASVAKRRETERAKCSQPAGGNLAESLFCMAVYRISIMLAARGIAGMRSVAKQCVAP